MRLGSAIEIRNTVDRFQRTNFHAPKDSSALAHNTEKPDRDGKKRKSWSVGLRVSRKDSDELGTVVEANESIKVEWDGGRTSYFRHDRQANVQLIRVGG